MSIHKKIFKKSLISQSVVIAASLMILASSSVGFAVPLKEAPDAIKSQVLETKEKVMINGEKKVNSATSTANKAASSVKKTFNSLW